MTGSNDNGATRLMSQDTEAYYRRRRCFLAEKHFYAVAGNHFRRRRGKVLRGETGVVADYQSTAV